MIAPPLSSSGTAVSGRGSDRSPSPICPTISTSLLGSPTRSVATWVGAVVRNRVRRRLQAAVTELVTTGHHQLPSGAYLFTVAPPAVALSFDELKDNVAAVIDLAQRRTPQPGAAR